MMVVPIAHAEVPEVTEVRRSLLFDPGEPLLTLAPIAPPSVVGLGVTETTERAAIRIGKRVTLTGLTTSWAGYADAAPGDGNERTVARGWRAGGELVYDLGWLQLAGSVMENGVSSQYADGRYRDISLSIRKSKKLSRWTTIWLALTVAQRTWEEVPPVGESDSTSATLSFGGTFR